MTRQRPEAQAFGPPPQRTLVAFSAISFAHHGWIAAVTVASFVCEGNAAA